ncbi:MAG: hypothetical protein M3419_01150 [Actinomycetota bacterium]|nr:hypothetical protein [Actinomycetota bacterium]
MNRLPTLEQYAATARRHLLLIIIGMLLGTAGGMLYLRSEPATHTATTTVLLGRIPAYVPTDPSDPAPRLITIDTDAAIVRSRMVSDAVAAATGLSQDQAQDALTVDAEPLSEVLRVSFSHPDADLAVRGADVAVDTLLELRSTTLPSSRTTKLRRLESELQDLVDQLDALLLSGTRLGGPATALEQQLSAQHTYLEEQLDQDPDVGRVLVEAQPPTQASRANPEVRIASGAMLGLLAGLGLGLVRDARRPKGRQVPAAP